jgi:hypothetical protein
MVSSFFLIEFIVYMYKFQHITYRMNTLACYGEILILYIVILLHKRWLDFKFILFTYRFIWFNYVKC